MPGTTAALLIEDDARLGTLVGEYLGKHEIDVTIAADGERGLDILRQRRVDVVLLDVGCPASTAWRCAAASGPSRRRRRSPSSCKPVAPSSIPNTWGSSRSVASNSSSLLTTRPGCATR